MRRGCLVLGLLIGWAAGVAAAEVAIRSEVDARRVGTDDEIELTITVEGSGVQLLEEIALPALKNLRVVGGPSVSTQISLVNGAMSQSRVYTYVLQPLAPGRAEVGPVVARLAGGDKTAPAIGIEVVAGSVRPRPARRANPFLDEDPLEAMLGGRRAQRPQPKLFVEASPSRTQLYVGESMVFTYYLYSQAAVTDLQFADSPQYPGFWAEDLERSKTPANGEGVTVGGEGYRRFPIGEKLLFPTRAGRLTIPAATLRIRVAPQGVFDRGAVVQRATRPVEVEAQAIPDEPGFSGAVGRFRASTTVGRRALSLGEAVTVRFRVEGTGNLKWVDRAHDLVVPGAKVYPPQSKSDLTADRSGLTGSRTWEFVVIPETSGELQIPPLSFSYFDPATGRLERTETAAIPLKVEGGSLAGGLPAPAPAVARGGGALPLRAELDPPRVAVPLLGGRTIVLLASLVLAVHGGLWALSRLGERRRLRAGRVSDRRSVRGALHDLEQAGHGGLSKEAAAALIEKTIHELFGPIDENGGPGDERERAARRILEEVHFIRYAPQLGDYSEKIRDLATRAREAVRRWA